jgi:hypothetical protein
MGLVELPKLKCSCAGRPTLTVDHAICCKKTQGIHVRPNLFREAIKKILERAGLVCTREGFIAA